MVPDFSLIFTFFLLLYTTLKKVEHLEWKFDTFAKKKCKYGNETLGAHNWWTDYFEESQIYFRPSNKTKDEYILKPEEKIAIESRLLGRDDVHYPVTFGIDRETLHTIIQKYVRVKSSILKKVDDFQLKLMKDFYVIGIHYRGTDTVTSYPNYKIPYSQFTDTINQLLETLSPKELENFRMFVATDEKPYLDLMKERYGEDRILYWDQSPRALSSNTTKGTHYTSLDSLSTTRYIRGESALIDSLLLSRCNYLIKNRSGLSNASVAFNPKLNFTLILE